MLNITLHNLQVLRSTIISSLRNTQKTLSRHYCLKKGDTPPKILFKYLLRECDKLPEGAKKYYKFMIKQSFKQHLNETDPDRIKQIISRSYEDAEWVLKKVFLEQRPHFSVNLIFFSTKKNKMDQIPLVTSSSITSLENFWNSVLIYHDRPNVVNRKLAAASPLLLCEITLHCPHIKRLHQIFTWECLIYEIRKLEDLTKITPNFIKSITETYDKSAQIKEVDWEVVRNSLEGTFISLQILHPRSLQQTYIQIVVFDKEQQLASFFAVQEHNTPTIAPRFPYHIKLTQNNNITIILNSFEDADTFSAEWLADKLFPKLLKWADNGILEDTAIKSLSLISSNDYCPLYSQLKQKYEHLVKEWPNKASTDPQKYVFEDLAIAAYLICLWRKLKSQDIYFVDCGCGNGLLVYVLNKEGYRGCGFDIRSRQVWDLFGNEADLKIGTITPEVRFAEATWIIGNHSDELTPWIPIIALNSSPKTNYFLLPCCPYDFSGRKYIRLNTRISQYEDYLSYVKKISQLCGFDTSLDKLRIPSTRRTCLIGVRADSSELEISKIRRDAISFVEKRGGAFSPRSTTESVRNCTHLKKNLIDKLVMVIFEDLLKTESRLLTNSAGKEWNQGGTKSVLELSQQIAEEDKKSLKNEHGGLQTLLKNHRYIFRVSKGHVSLQKPLSLKESEKYQDKPCWFLKNHPNGCFFDSNSCAYKH